MAGVGCVGWLVATTRLDLMSAHVRLSQYMANPTAGAVAGLRLVLEYLVNTKDLCLTVPLEAEGDRWKDGSLRFYSDSFGQQGIAK